MAQQCSLSSPPAATASACSRGQRHLLLWLLLSAVMCAWLSSHTAAATGGTCGVAVCFAIDESSSQSPANFAQAMQFVKDVVGNISQVSSEWVAQQYCTSAGRALDAARHCHVGWSWPAHSTDWVVQTVTAMQSSLPLLASLRLGLQRTCTQPAWLFISKCCRPYQQCQAQCVRFQQP
jgi:hypothetical protein